MDMNLNDELSVDVLLDDNVEVGAPARNTRLPQMMRRIPVTLTLEVGSARISLQDLMDLGPASVLPLDAVAVPQIPGQVLAQLFGPYFRPLTGKVVAAVPGVTAVCTDTADRALGAPVQEPWTARTAYCQVPSGTPVSVQPVAASVPEQPSPTTAAVSVPAAYRTTR